ALNQTFELLLEPNHDLLHAMAVVEIHGGSEEGGIGSVSDGGSITRAIRAHVYKGHAIETDLDGRREKVGWSRITFRDDNFFSMNERDVLFDGVFTTSQGMYHVKEIEAYKRSKRDMDIDPESPLSRPPSVRRSRLMIFKDEDERPRRQIVPRSDGSFLSGGLEDAERVLGSVSTCGSHEHGLTKREVAQVSGCAFDPMAGKDAILDYHIQAEAKVSKFVKRQVQCPSSRRVLFMAAAGDCTYVRQKGGPDAALAAILSNWNQASQVYESTFNVSLGLIKVELHQTCTPTDTANNMMWNQECSDGYTINNRLSDFSRWRGSKAADQAGLWHLMTKCNTGASVGVAWLSTLCANTTFTQNTGGSQQFVSGTGVSSIVPVEWKVVAHEIGHSKGLTLSAFAVARMLMTLFGAVQILGPYTIARPTCALALAAHHSAVAAHAHPLMHPTDNAQTDQFSPCSISQICSEYPKLGKCLQLPGALKTITSGICGNGVKEGNEECDCGTPDDCRADKCCGADCKFKNGAKCSDKNDECCANCQIKARNTPCRPSTGFCDIEEVCDGTNVTCPAETFIPDGTSCNVTSNGTTVTAACASGTCTSRDLQCKSHASSIVTTSACPGHDSECQLFCQTAKGDCLLLNGFFVDGTPCGINGKCKAGKCDASNILIDWAKANPQFAIPILVLIGLVILALLSSILRCIFCRRPRSPKISELAASPPPQSGVAGRSTAPGWVDPTPYNGGSGIGFPVMREGQPQPSFGNDVREYSPQMPDSARPASWRSSASALLPARAGTPMGGFGGREGGGGGSPTGHRVANGNIVAPRQQAASGWEGGPGAPREVVTSQGSFSNYPREVMTREDMPRT
ncbi:hypothetical protein HK104_003819, partial [Borealophlyctis nickersoniae]